MILLNQLLWGTLVVDDNVLVLLVGLHYFSAYLRLPPSVLGQLRDHLLLANKFIEVGFARTG